MNHYRIPEEKFRVQDLDRVINGQRDREVYERLDPVAFSRVFETTQALMILTKQEHPGIDEARCQALCLNQVLVWEKEGPFPEEARRG